MGKPGGARGGAAGHSPKNIMSKPSKPKVDPLVSRVGRKWLDRQIEEAERVLRLGPGETGWRHNESLRSETEEGAAFLKALRELLPK